MMKLAKRGRKPRQTLAPARVASLRRKIAAWKLTPPERREPPTLRALAGELGISPQLASYYASTIPENWSQLVEEGDKAGLLRHGEIIDKLTELAAEGNLDAIRTYLRELAAHYRQPQAQGLQGPRTKSMGVLVSLLPKSRRRHALDTGDAVPASPPTELPSLGADSVQNPQIPSNSLADDLPRMS